MASHQARNAQLRQTVRNVLAELRGVSPQLIHILDPMIGYQNIELR